MKENRNKIGEKWKKVALTTGGEGNQVAEKQLRELKNPEEKEFEKTRNGWGCGLKSRKKFKNWEKRMKIYRKNFSIQKKILATASLA